MSENQEARLRVAYARLKLMRRDNCGLYAEIGYSLSHVQDETIPTLCTDGRTLSYNPDFFMGLNPEQQQSALAHEYAHVALMHPVRVRPQHTAKRANIAMDHAVNLMLRESGLQLGKGWHADPQYAGMSWEHIYTLLPRIRPPRNNRLPLWVSASQETRKATCARTQARTVNRHPTMSLAPRLPS